MPLQSSPMQATLEAALDAIAADPRNGDPSPLVELVNALRPGAGRHHREAIANLHALTSLLTHRPTYGSALRAYLLHLIATRRPVHLYANTGIQSQEGFGRALMQKLAFRILPPALDRDSLEDILTLVFWKGDDWRWLRAIPPESWDQLFATLAHGEPGNEEDMKKVRLSILEAAQVISYRIAAIGLDPEFLRNEASAGGTRVPVRGTTDRDPPLRRRLPEMAGRSERHARGRPPPRSADRPVRALPPSHPQQGTAQRHERPPDLPLAERAPVQSNACARCCGWSIPHRPRLPLAT